jgi:hypothetical protein
VQEDKIFIRVGKTMRRWFFISTLLLSIVLVLGLLKAPAQIVSNASAQLFPELTLNSVSGTVWRGTAQQASWKVGPAELPLGQLQWSVNWSRLLKLEPVVDVHTQAQAHDFEGQIELISGGIRLRGGQGQFPLSLLEAWIPLLVSADVSIQLKELIYRDGRFVELIGLLSAKQVAWEVGDYQMPLGAYQADVAMLDGEMTLLIDDLQAALGANAEMRFHPEGHYYFNAVLTPRATLAPEINRVIGWLGRRDEGGNVLISRQGRWR